jgi:hypothetical protein
MEIAIRTDKLYRIWSINRNYRLYYYDKETEREYPIDAIEQLHIGSWLLEARGWEKDYALCVCGDAKITLRRLA